MRIAIGICIDGSKHPPNLDHVRKHCQQRGYTKSHSRTPHLSKSQRLAFYSSRQSTQTLGYMQDVSNLESSDKAEDGEDGCADSRGSLARAIAGCRSERSAAGS